MRKPGGGFARVTRYRLDRSDVGLHSPQDGVGSSSSSSSSSRGCFSEGSTPGPEIIRSVRGRSTEVGRSWIKGCLSDRGRSGGSGGSCRNSCRL